AHPALRPDSFYTAAQLAWFTPSGATPDATYWGDANNHAIAWRYDGAALGDSAAYIYVAYNGWSGDVNFVLPWANGKGWYRVTDTSTWAEGPNQVDTAAISFVGNQGMGYVVHGRGLFVLVAK